LATLDKAAIAKPVFPYTEQTMLWVAAMDAISLDSKAAATPRTLF